VVKNIAFRKLTFDLCMLIVFAVIIHLTFIINKNRFYF